MGIRQAALSHRPMFEIPIYLRLALPQDIPYKSYVNCWIQSGAYKETHSIYSKLLFYLTYTYKQTIFKCKLVRLSAIPSNTSSVGQMLK